MLMAKSTATQADYYYFEVCVLPLVIGPIPSLCPCISVLASQFCLTEFIVGDPQVIVLMEKLILTGLLIFINQGSTFQAFCGGAVAFSFFAVQCSTMPYASGTDNVLKAVAEAELFVTLFISVVLRTDASNDRDAITAAQYGAILTAVLFAAPAAFVIAFIYGRCCAGKKEALAPSKPYEKAGEEFVVPQKEQESTHQNSDQAAGSQVNP